ncbi:MAG TPA: SAM-dependent methyltransferase [Candidatus Nitrosotenuis sp.]|jgi:NADH dehydrogenase [ubiquinone] 1 alpha subcomplex assembly factor 7|nr:SAM-dependent methyltransferase [Candidatus Nitrosotenuis sp.]
MPDNSSILDYIENHGPLPVDEFFRLAMYHPTLGYYQRKIPMGSSGDYITAPEISQVFGELIGLWCLDVWQKLGCPNPIHIIELGPGQGSLMVDLVRTAQLIPAFAHALKIHLIEASSRLRMRQKEQLNAYSPEWHDTLTTLPPEPAIFIANEFFDALPHKQYQAQNNSWYERMIGSQNNQLFWTIAHAPTTLSIPPGKEGKIVEIPQEGIRFLNQISQHLNHHNGAVLIIDYGTEIDEAYGDTLQALYRHQRCSPLEEPGQRDLTFHVNFHLLRQILNSHNVDEIYIRPQRDFLLEMGITERTNQLATLNPQVAMASFRLISSQHMGQLFKVLGASFPKLQLIGFS